MHASKLWSFQNTESLKAFELAHLKWLLFSPLSQWRCRFQTFFLDFCVVILKWKQKKENSANSSLFSTSNQHHKKFWSTGIMNWTESPRITDLYIKGQNSKDELNSERT